MVGSFQNPSRPQWATPPRTQRAPLAAQGSGGPLRHDPSVVHNPAEHCICAGHAPRESQASTQLIVDGR
jgi:hypothetical protein